MEETKSPGARSLFPSRLALFPVGEELSGTDGDHRHDKKSPVHSVPPERDLKRESRILDRVKRLLENKLGAF